VEVLQTGAHAITSLAGLFFLGDERQQMADWYPEMCRLSIEELQTRWLLLLTGTPIQNNMKELYSIMNLVKPDEFYNCDAFLTRFGNPPALPSSPEQLQDLQVRTTSIRVHVTLLRARTFRRLSMAAGRTPTSWRQSSMPGTACMVATKHAMAQACPLCALWGASCSMHWQYNGRA
jgi:hypothetical protein